MPSVRTLSKLFQAVKRRDIADAEAIAAQIASDEEKMGHTSAARTLRAALAETAFRGIANAESISGIVVREKAVIESGLIRRRSAVNLASVHLRPALRKTIQEILLEIRNRETLVSRGVGVRSKLLLLGPPGCGKSLTAEAFAGELGLPFLTVRLNAVIGSYLGQTGNHIREIFRFTSSYPCVLLIDEIDAIGKRRGAIQDVGELDRVAIAMMQELEFFDSRGLLIATSNLPKALDEALFRRFDAVLDFPRPSSAELSSFGSGVADRLSVRIDRKCLASVRKSKSYAEAEKLVIAYARKTILKEITQSGGSQNPTS